MALLSLAPGTWRSDKYSVHTTLGSFTNGRSDDLEAEEFSIVTAYDTEQDFSQAKQLAQNLTREFSSDFHFEHRPWPIALLATAGLRANAISEAKEARLIILALKTDHDIPESLCRWIEASMEGRSPDDFAIVGLLQRGPEVLAAAPAVDFLKQLGKRANVFLSVASDPLVESGAESLAEHA